MPLSPFSTVETADVLETGRQKINMTFEILRNFVNGLEESIDLLTPEQIGDLIVDGKINPVYVDEFLGTIDASNVIFSGPGYSATDVEEALNEIRSLLTNLTPEQINTLIVDGKINPTYLPDASGSVDAADVTFSSPNYDSTNVEDALNEIIDIIPDPLPSLNNARHGLADIDYYFDEDVHSPTATGSINFFEVEIIPPNGAAFNYVTVNKLNIPDPISLVTLSVERNNGDSIIDEVVNLPATEVSDSKLTFRLPYPVFVDRQEIVKLKIDFPSATEDYILSGTVSAFDRFFDSGDNIWYLYQGFRRPPTFGIGLTNNDDPGSSDDLLEAKTAWTTRHMPHGTEHISFNGDGYFYFLADRPIRVVRITEAGTGTINFRTLFGGDEGDYQDEDYPDEQPLDSLSSFITLGPGDVLRVGVTGCTSWKSVAMYWRKDPSYAGNDISAL